MLENRLLYTQLLFPHINFFHENFSYHTKDLIKNIFPTHIKKNRFNEKNKHLICISSISTNFIFMYIYNFYLFCNYVFHKLQLKQHEAIYRKLDCRSVNRIRLKVNREKNRFKEQSLNVEPPKVFVIILSGSR